eukprot:11173132-Karenia_brevis.AAC.1
MVAEPDRETQASQKSGVPMNKEFWYQMKMLMDKMFQQKSKSQVRMHEESKRVTLEEKYFRRMS